ncbi:MAG: fumarylacetoacetate hydrolase family protein [Promethearchaeota archaeon]
MSQDIKLGQCLWKDELYSCLYENDRVILLKERNINFLLNSANVDHLEKSEAIIGITEVQMEAPVKPSKIVCLGRNYQFHAKEMGEEVPDEPLLFLKPPSSVNGPDAPIIYPPQTKDLHYEGEVALVVRQRISKTKKEDLSQIPRLYGVACFNDVTARDLQRKDKTWVRGKGFDTFACIGPWVVLEPIEKEYRIQTKVNGEVRQNGSTHLMKFQFLDILAYISTIMTLEVGDVIATGTPAGVGSMHVADVVEVEINNIGRLRNQVVAVDLKKERKKGFDRE